MTSEQPIRIEYAAEFQKNLKRLRKKYPHIRDDLQTLLDRLMKGETPGDHVPGAGYTVYKVRVRSSDQSRGKRGGFRVMYYIKMPNFVALMTIYPKSARSDLPLSRLKRIIGKRPLPKEGGFALALQLKLHPSSLAGLQPPGNQC